MQVKRDSWHYKMNFKYGNAWPSETYNLCQYFWMTVKNCIWFTILGCIFTAFAGLTVMVMLVIPVLTIIDMYNGIPFMTVFKERPGLVPTFVVYTSLFLIGIYHLYKKYMPEKKYVEETPPGFIRSAFRDWKEKHCTLITYK